MNSATEPLTAYGRPIWCHAYFERLTFLVAYWASVLLPAPESFCGGPWSMATMRVVRRASYEDRRRFLGRGCG